MKALSEALALAARTGDCWWNAELHRLTGELLLQQKSKSDEEKRTKLKGKARQLQSISRVNESQSEGCLQRALDVALVAKKRSRWNCGQLSAWRVCASTKGESKEARRLVETSYNWFREGFATADLQAAKALIKELDEKAPKGGRSSTEDS